MKITEVMSWVIEWQYVYGDILTLIKSILFLVQVDCFWFKEYTKTMTIKAVFKKSITDPSILYILNELGTLIFIIYVDDTLAFRDKSALKNII